MMVELNKLLKYKGLVEDFLKVLNEIIETYKEQMRIIEENKFDICNAYEQLLALQIKIKELEGVKSWFERKMEILDLRDEDE